MQDYYFSGDKNHILKDAQFANKEVLLDKWVIKSLEAYLAINNPMGLVDDFIQKITSIRDYDISFLGEAYDFLAASYRLKYSSNQLEFLWDGRSHFVKYTEDWEIQFDSWVRELAFLDPLNRMIIKTCILKESSNHMLLEKNFTRIMLSHLKLKWDGRKKSLVKAA